MKCTKCKNEMVYVDIFKKFACNACNIMVDVQKEPAPWHMSLSKDEKIWYDAAFFSYPFIISHEYNRLKDMLSDGEIYGSIMQILSKPLCIGDWEFIGSETSKLSVEKDLPAEYGDIYLPLIKMVKDIIKVFSSLNISKWRNETIGHGALALVDNINDEAQYEQDFKKLLYGLKAIMEKCSHFYNDYVLVANNDTIVSGIGINMKSLNDLKSFRIQKKSEQNTYIELDPFLILDNSKIFILDSFNQNKGQAFVLNYSHGLKSTYAKLAERLEDLNKTLMISSVGNTWGEAIQLSSNLIIDSTPKAAAKQLGISNGVGSNLFAPEKAISRQEMFTLLYNALTVIGQLPQGDSGKKLSNFTDAGQVVS